MNHIGDTVRVLLELALVVVIYTETGWATALFVVLATARMEILDYNAGRTFK